MVKVWNPQFNVNILSNPTAKTISKNVNISRRCLAVVTKVKGEYKVVVNYEKGVVNVTDKYTLNNEQLVLPFTEESLDLKGKIYVWRKEKDKYGHNVCIIRDAAIANRFPGTTAQYDPVKENNLISGYIIRVNGKMYFEYEDLVAFHYLITSNINIVDIDESKPLFIK